MHSALPTHLPTWAAPDVVADDLEALAAASQRLGVSRRDARALRRVALIVRAHDERDEVRTAS